MFKWMTKKKPKSEYKPTSSVLQSLVENLDKRFENKLPTIQVTSEEIALLQGQQIVVNYIKEYLQVNSKEIERDGLLRDSD